MQEKTHFRTCHLCEAMCGLEIKTRAKQVISIKGDKKDPLSRGHICPKAVALKDIYEDPDRLRYPVKRMPDGTWQEIGWEAAFDEVGERLLQIQSRYGRDAIGVYQGNPSVHNLGTALFARQFVRFLKTKNVYSATSVDQLPHHLAAMTMFGHAALMPVPDIDRTDLWIILGGNPLVSNGSIMTAPDMSKRMRAIQKRGGKIMVIDPRRTETANRADEYIPVRPGSDVWLLLAVLNYFLKKYGFRLGHLEALISEEDRQLLQQTVRPYSIEKAAQKTGIPASVIQHIADELASAETAVIYGRMGVSTVRFGSLCQWLINVINIVTGNMDTPGGYMLTSPAFDPIRPPKGKPMRFNRWKSRVRQLPEFSGELPSVTLAEEILTPGEGQIRAMVTSCGNPVLSVPNGKKLDKALGELEFMVSVDIYLNETTRHADFILPPATGLEVPHFDIVFNQLAIRNVVKYSEPVFEKEEGMCYDYEIFLELLKRMEAPHLPKDQATQERFLAKYQMTPQMILDMGLRGGTYRLSLEEVKKHPHGMDLGALKSRFPERLLTDDQRIHLIPAIYLKDLERLQNDSVNGELLLIGRRHLRSNNSWMHNSQRLVKGPERCVALVHPADAQKHQIKDGEQVEISSRTGTIVIPAAVSDEVMQGVVSIPHGWGHHREGVRLQIAAKYAGVSANDLTDEYWIDELTGNASVNGVPIKIRTLATV